MLIAALLAAAIVAALHAIRCPKRGSWPLVALLWLMALLDAAQRHLPHTGALTWLYLLRVALLPCAAAVLLCGARGPAVAPLGCAAVVAAHWRWQVKGLAFSVEGVDLLASTVCVFCVLFWAARRRSRTPATMSIVLLSCIDATVAIGAYGEYYDAQSWADRGIAYSLAMTFVIILHARELWSR